MGWMRSAATSWKRSGGMLLLGVFVAAFGIGAGSSLPSAIAGHDEPDVIHACVDNQTGEVRIVENPDECDTVAENQSRTRRDDLPGPERVLEWNQQGPTGPVGPQGPQGEPGLVWRGPWDSTLHYRVDDAVSYQGDSYVAVATSTGEEPGTGSSWELLASQGARGPGTTGTGRATRSTRRTWPDLAGKLG